MTGIMTPMQRTLAAMSFKEPDRVPWFLFCTMHGAKELNLSIREYFAKPEYVAKGQVLIQKKYGSDCYYALCYAAAEAEAWGSDILWRNDGPPNAGAPVIKTPEDIERMEVPVIEECPPLVRTLRVIELLKPSAKGDIPIICAAVSPFSLPVMQMGFEAYLNLIYDEPDLFRTLMKKNAEFCIAWSNALFEAGTTALAYFDPLASPDMIPPDLYRKTGRPVAKQVLSGVKGPMAVHLASGRTLPVIDDIVRTGFAGIGFSAKDDITALKDACRGKLTLMGNLNGIAMRRWTPAEAENTTKDLILKAGRGGGFILADNHGEIPYQVPGPVLSAIGGAIRKYGTYPLG